MKSAISKTCLALFADRRSNNATNAPRPVGAYVVRSYANGNANVYDLMVDETHEFTANGIIVHNCVWAVSDLMAGQSAMMGFATFAKFCPVCRLPSPARATACTSCGEPLGV
jgi:hypothetical protein